MIVFWIWSCLVTDAQCEISLLMFSDSKVKLLQSRNVCNSSSEILCLLLSPSKMSHLFFMLMLFVKNFIYMYHFCIGKAKKKNKKKTLIKWLERTQNLVIWKLGDFQIWNILLCYLNTVVLWLCITSKPISYKKSRWSDILL